jgi:hypothetical protein
MVSDNNQSGIGSDDESFEFVSDAFAAEVPAGTMPVEPVTDVATTDITQTPAEPAQDRRRLPRARYEVTATLSTEGEEATEFVLYTRDVNSTGSGFIAPVDMFSVGAATNAPVTIAIPTPDGQVRHVRCQVQRAREIGEGWVEGYVSFNEPASVFSSKRINAAHAEARKPIFAGA